MNILRFASGLLLLCGALPASALAHDTWLMPDKFNVAPKSTVTLDLTSGMEFPKLDVGPKPERVESAKGRLAGRTFDMKETTAAAKSLQAKAELSEAGIATLWLKLQPKALELKPEEVEHYLEEVSPPEELKKQWAEMNPKRWRELYAKHQKTFVRVGQPQSDTSWREPVGTFLEIVPEKDPTAVKAGDEFPVRVLKHGAPIAGFSLNAVPANETKGETRQTDSEGRVVFHLDKAGPWLLRGTDIRKSSKPDTDFESHFVTLTLEAAGK